MILQKCCCADRYERSSVWLASRMQEIGTAGTGPNGLRRPGIPLSHVAGPGHRAAGRIGGPLSAVPVPSPVPVRQAAKRSRMIVYGDDQVAKVLYQVLGRDVPRQTIPVRELCSAPPRAVRNLLAPSQRSYSKHLLDLCQSQPAINTVPAFPRLPEFNPQARTPCARLSTSGIAKPWGQCGRHFPQEVQASARVSRLA